MHHLVDLLLLPEQIARSRRLEDPSPALLVRVPLLRFLKVSFPLFVLFRFSPWIVKSTVLLSLS